MSEHNDTSLHRLELKASRESKVSILNFLAQLKMEFSRTTIENVWNKYKEEVKNMFPKISFEDKYRGKANQNYRLLQYLRQRIKNGEIFDRETFEFRTPIKARQDISELIKLVESGKNWGKRRVLAEKMIREENWEDLQVLKNQDVINAIWGTVQKRRGAIGKGINIGFLLENRYSVFNKNDHPNLGSRPPAAPPRAATPKPKPKTNEEWARDAKMAENLVDAGRWKELEQLTNQDVLNAIMPNYNGRKDKAIRGGLIMRVLLTKRNSQFEKNEHPKLLPAKTDAEWKRDAEVAGKLIDEKNWKELEKYINQDVVNAIWRTSRRKEEVIKNGLDINHLLNNNGLQFNMNSHPIQEKITKPEIQPKPTAEATRVVSERLNEGVEVNSFKDFIVIGDSNAVNLAKYLPGSRKITKSAKSSPQILAKVRMERSKIRGAKVGIISVGGNDGNLSAKNTMANIEKIVQICIEEGIKDIRVLTRAPYATTNKSWKLRRASGDRRLASIEKFRNKILPNGVKVAVLDAYSFLSDGQDNLRREYAKGGGALHMGPEGNEALAEWIGKKLGVEHMFATPEKAGRARRLVESKKWNELESLTNQDIINGIWGSRTRKEEAARNGIELTYLVNNRYEKFDINKHPGIVDKTPKSANTQPTKPQNPAQKEQGKSKSTPSVVINMPSPVTTTQSRQIEEAGSIAPKTQEALKVGKQPEWNKKITLTFDDSLRPTLELIERLEQNGITNYRIYGEFGTAIKPSVLQKMGIKGNARSTKLTPGKWLSEWIDVKRGSLSRKQYIRQNMLKGPGDTGTDYLTMGTKVRDRFKKLYPNNWQDKLEQTFGYHAAIIHPTALDKVNHIQYWTKAQIQEDVETYEEFMMAWLDISEFKVRHLRTPEGGGFGYSGAWRKGASARNAQRLIGVINEFRQGATWDMWNVDSNDVKGRGKINPKTVAKDAVRNLSRSSSNTYAPKGETLVLMHTKNFSGKQAWQVDNLARAMGEEYEKGWEKLGEGAKRKIGKMGNAKIDNAFIRKSPEKSNRREARVVRKLAKGEPIFVQERVPGMPDWYKVGWGKNGKITGFIHKSQLSNVNTKEPATIPSISEIKGKMSQIKPQYRHVISLSEREFITRTIDRYKNNLVEQNRDQYMVFVDRAKEYAVIIHFTANAGTYEIVGNFGAKTSTGRENPAGKSWATPLGVYNLKPFTEKRISEKKPEWRTNDSGGGGFGTYGSRVFHLGYVDVNSPWNKNASIAMHKTDRNSLKILGEKSKSHGCIRIADGLMDILDQNYLLDSSFGHHVIVGDSHTENTAKYYQDHGVRELQQDRNRRTVTRR